MRTVTSEPVARKRHWCEVCGWPVEPQEKYVRAVTFDCGDVLTWKAHIEPCTTAVESARAADYGEDGLISGEDVREWACETARHDPLGHPEAVEIKRRLAANEERAREEKRTGLRGGKH